jgi:hypothetical protein
MDTEKLEKYSSAITLSDMEVFVFPELMYSLVLANIMSPVIWRWRDEESFRKLEGKGSYKKLMRLKQYIMDNYEFNLDLETWGLTSQQRELKRFESFVSPDDIARSNALFGYEGDKYYFDVDIRRHFGLDKYDSDIIPYWKTETVEAMDAFRHKEGYRTGAGECVSLAALYAAAAFVVCEIPLDDIYMILTPLHSQNFLDINDGVLTNNRRIVTKTMWFNGTAISNKAQRAMRNENVTIVAHNSGYVHCMYDTATIRPQSYDYFRTTLAQYLSSELTLLTFSNFLRSHPKYQQYFQFCCESCRGGQKYVMAEVLFHYEHGSKFRIAEDTFEKLIDEVSEEDLHCYKLAERLCCRQLITFTQYEDVDLRDPQGRAKAREYLVPFIPEVDEFLGRLTDFLYVHPSLPSPEKQYVDSIPIEITTDMDRQQMIEYMASIRDESPTADLAFYAFRDVQKCRWEPFIKAAMERNPVSLEKTSSMSIDEAHNWLQRMPDQSIYEGPRLAQPDEVSNYGRGDGVEKAFLLANVIRSRHPEQDVRIIVNDSEVVLRASDEYGFQSAKGLSKRIDIAADGEYIAE